MGFYRKKPVVIEAFQMTKERRLDNSEWPNWLHQAWQKRIIEIGSLFCSSDGSLEGEEYTPLFLQTPQGTRKIFWDDWIIREHTGELCACSPRLFEAENEAVEDEGSESPVSPTELSQGQARRKRPCDGNDRQEMTTNPPYQTRSTG